MKVAIVTGASSGLGRELTRKLLANDYRVAVIGRSAVRLQSAIAGYENRAKIVEADLSQATSVEGLVERCLAELQESSVDLLINCAGFAVTGKLQDIPEVIYEQCWRVNFTSAVSLVKQSLPHMIRENSGMIVNVSSGVARRALPFISPYCSAKAALSSFTESLRVELAFTQIKVMLFSPGPVTSGFHDSTVHCGETVLAFPPFIGVEAEIVAQKLFRAIEQKRTRVVLGFRASLAYHLNYWLPSLTDLIVRLVYRIQ